MSIRRIGYQTIRLDRIVCPGDMPQVRKERFTRQLGDSYDLTGGQPAEPVIIDTKRILRAGKHRVAAAMNRELERIDVLVFDGTEEELSVLTDVENAVRRHDPAARDSALARMVKSVVPPKPDEYESPEPVKHKPGRPMSEHGKAVREVASRTGHTENQVYAAVRRQEAKEKPAEEPQEFMRTLGLELPDAVRVSAQDEHSALSSMADTLSTLAGRLTRHQNATGRKDDYYQHLGEHLHNMAAQCRSLLPWGVCLWCKCTSLRSDCLGCAGKGWLTKAQWEQVSDQELHRSGLYACVYVNGALVKVTEVK